jgi:hypothetical protein
LDIVLVKGLPGQLVAPGETFWTTVTPARHTTGIRTSTREANPRKEIISMQRLTLEYKSPAS